MFVYFPKIIENNIEEALPPQEGITPYFHHQRLGFAYLGINLTSLKRTYVNYFLVLIPMMSQAIFFLPVFRYVVANYNDVFLVADALTPCFQVTILLTKFANFVIKRKRIVKLIRKIWMWNLEAKGEEFNILAEENRKDVIFCKIYFKCVIATGYSGMLVPLFVACFYTLRRGGKFMDYLVTPFIGDYFVDSKTPLGYAIVFTFNSFIMYFAMYMTISTDTLFSWFLCNTIAQFRILKYRLSQASSENNSECSMKTIRNCIVYHLRTLELANEFNEVYRVVVFIKFSISCIQTCCLAYKLLHGGGEVFEHVFNALFLVVVSTHLILYCYGGQKVQDESLSVAETVYDSFHWESLPLPQKRNLLLVILRSQKPCDISGIFFTASLYLFLWVCRSTISFVGMLKTLDS